MKLASYVHAGRATYGAVKKDGLIDLGARLPYASLRQLLASDGLSKAKQLLGSVAADVALSEVSFAPVISDPDKIICVGMNYHDHVAEIGRTVTEKPALFARFAGSQVGHLQPMIKPAVSDAFDYEGELAVVVGKAGRHVKPERALEHVAGYACYN